MPHVISSEGCLAIHRGRTMSCHQVRRSPGPASAEPSCTYACVFSVSPNSIGAMSFGSNAIAVISFALYAVEFTLTPICGRA